MELLIWHEALGSDDEQATEQELLARLLFAHVEGDIGESVSRSSCAQTMQSLHLMEALVTFTRLIRQQKQKQCGDPPSAYEPHWTNVTLCKRRFLIREVEPQIYFALGVKTAEIHGNDTRSIHQSVLQDIYDSFTVFHGSVDHQLRQLPEDSSCSSRFDDGMAVLQRIAILRKRLRKSAIEKELHRHEVLTPSNATAEKSDDNSVHEMEEELATLETISQTMAMQRRCESFFPKLLSVMDASQLNAFLALDGVSSFPMNESTLLSLQALINSFHQERRDVLAGDDCLAVFFKGNLLWRRMDKRTLHALLMFLRLREQDGMDIATTQTATSTTEDSLWMNDKYDDAFSPVWASKTTYAECAVVQHIASHPRRSARSLHKQSSSSLSSIVSDLAASPSEGSTTTSRTAMAEQILIRRGQRYRNDTPTYRNRGFLTQNGYFLPGWEIAKSEGQESAWVPTVFQGSKGVSSRALVWHERDLTVLMLTKKTRDLPEMHQQMERIEDSLDKLQLNASFASSISQQRTGSFVSRDKASTSLPPHICLDEISCTFAANQIPRLIKTKEDDLFPRPAALWARYFPLLPLQLLNDSYATLHSDPDNVEVRIKTVNDGWIFARRSCVSRRELYALLDTKVVSVADVDDAINQLLLSNKFL